MHPSTWHPQSEEAKELVEKQEAIRVVKEVEQKSHDIMRIGRDYLDRIVVRLQERQKKLLDDLDGTTKENIEASKIDSSIRDAVYGYKSKINY